MPKLLVEKVQPCRSLGTNESAALECVFLGHHVQSVV